MDMMLQHSWVKKIAQAGLISKGVVYIMLGIIGFMAAFELGRNGSSTASSKGIFETIGNLPAGVVLLTVTAIGLVCYTLWRFVQAATFQSSDDKNTWGKKLVYLFSGIGYGSLAFTAFTLLLQIDSDNGDQKQDLAAQLLQKSYGQWLAGAVALLFAGLGAYQIYYGLAEKYRKKLGDLNSLSPGSSLLFLSGKIGYIARGIVWLIVAYLFLNAAMHNNSSEAGGTVKAFNLVESASFGSILLGALGLGLFIYGCYNFVRARYERL